MSHINDIIAMKDYYDSSLSFIKLIRIKDYWITIKKSTGKERNSIKIFYNHWCLSVGEIQKQFNEQWLSCKASLKEHFLNDSLTFKHFNDVLDILDNLFTNKYNSIYQFITTYPEEDSYANNIYNSMCDVLRDILHLLMDYTKELAKIIINDDEDYDLTYIKESIEQIKQYHIEC